MRKLITNRWFLGALMVLALGLAIWFVGPAIAIFNFRPLDGTTTRVALIVLITAIWLGIELGQLWASRRANQKLLEGIASSGADVDASAAKSAEEVAALRQRFEEAATTLKQARFENSSGEKQFLYELPWYVFIGAPGSGKTTALINSGLRFPLGSGPEGQAIKGVGGTRNCDWWFTDEAVLLDTAGRYTTQESEQKTDAAAWLGFLDLLKQYRPKRPLNGAIITVSVSDLLVWSDSDRARYADAVRQRIQELYTRLGIRFPLYVVVTKCDLLAGFNEFYASFGREERAQVWGMTFPHTPDATVAADYAGLFEAEYQALELRLNGLLLDRVQQERDQQRRSLVYNFPQQFSGLKAALASFVASVFQGSRYAEQAMLRGIYFTSGTQEGSPIDRVLGTLARSFNLERKILPPAMSSGKSFFLTNLLKDLIFPEAGLVGANAKLERKLKLALIGGYSLVAVLTLTLLSLWGVSYFRNDALISEFETKANAVKVTVDALPAPKPGDLVPVIQVLSDLRALSEPYSNAGYHVPWSLGFGLYQGKKLSSQAIRTYNVALKEALLPRVGLRLEQLLRESGNAIDQYDTLKTYLMLYSDKVLDPKALEDFMLRDWVRTNGTADSGQSSKMFQEHLRTALRNRPLEIERPQNEQLVNDARQNLASASLPERIYARLLQEGMRLDLAPFRLSDASGPAAAQAFARASKRPLTEGVPGIFTMAGYTKTISPAMEPLTRRMLEEESWVLGPKFAGSTKASSSGQVLNDVRRRYFEDYIRAWDNFFDDIRLVPSSGLAQTLQLVKLLSGPDSPMKRLMQNAAKEVSFADSAEGTTKATVARAATDAVVDFAKKALGSNAPKLEAASPGRPEAVVDEHFRNLRLFVTASPGGRAPMDALMESLKEYAVRLDAVAEALRRGDSLGPKLVDATQLRADAEQSPPPIRQILGSLVVASVGQTAGAARDKLATDVGGAASFCEKAIGGRYPFTRNAQAEVTIDDFSKVFAPGGDLDEFFQKNLASLVDTSGRQWRARSGEGGAALPAQTIAQFQRAASIRDAFFRGGVKTPAAAADLALVAIDDRLTHATIEIDNQVLRFDRIASLQRITWPSQRAGGRVRLQVYPTGSAMSFEGSWALFRLIDRGNPQTGSQPERMQITYVLDGSRVVFELRAQSAVYNPFKLQALEEFRCPVRR